MDKPTIIDCKSMPLADWLDLLQNPPENTLFTMHEFPTDQHREEYIASINTRPESDVKQLLLRFLVPTGSLGLDQFRLHSLIAIKNRDTELFRRILEFQSTKRLLLYASGEKEIPPWEGITWILDLLPHFPKQALEAVSAYILAHAQQLPDGRYRGLHDAMEIIRAKYIGLPGNVVETVEMLKTLQSRELECLVERLYHWMDYDTMITPPKNDGGRDILASMPTIGKREQLLIECKRYSNPVGVEYARGLLGVVSSEKVNKGVLVTTSRFTRGARSLAKSNPRLELIDGENLVLLMNEHLGSKWPVSIEKLVIESERKASKETEGSNNNDGTQ